MRATLALLVGWLLDSGRSRSAVVAVLRILAGAVFLQAGAGKFVNHDAYIRRFDRWGLPEPSAFSYAIGTLEVVAGTLLVIGLLARPGALLLACNMVGAFTTAGRVDGGQNLVLPPILFVVCVLVALTGGGAWQVVGRLRSRGGTPPEPA